MGFRYGFALFEQTLNNYIINTGNNVFDPIQNTTTITQDGLTAHWTEFVIGLKAEIGKITDNNLSNDVKNKVSFLSGIWNSMPKNNFKSPENNELSNYYFDPVIIHLAGIRKRDRLKFIREYKNLFI